MPFSMVRSRHSGTNINSWATVMASHGAHFKSQASFIALYSRRCRYVQIWPWRHIIEITIQCDTTERMAGFDIYCTGQCHSEVWKCDAPMDFNDTTILSQLAQWNKLGGIRTHTKYLCNCKSRSQIFLERVRTIRRKCDVGFTKKQR